MQGLVYYDLIFMHYIFILIFGCGIGVLRYEVLIVLIVELLVTNIAMREQGIEFVYMVIALDVNQSK